MFGLLSETMIAVLSTLLSALTGVSVSVIELFYKKKRLLANEKKQQEILSGKIEKLTQSLHESSRLMIEIEAEFDRQKKLAEKWKEELGAMLNSGAVLQRSALFHLKMHPRQCHH